MRELSDGVMASYIRSKVLLEYGERRWVDNYRPDVSYFLDCLCGSFGRDPKHIYPGVRTLLVSNRLDQQ
eukprot:1493278-Karenia_brevis.AAC.1